MKNLKKFLMVSIACVFVLAISGCEKVEEGNYKEGTYFGSVEAASYGKTYVTTAVVYVNENGVIKSVFIDNTYFKDEKYTTKKVLGDAYGMKQTSAANGVIEGGAEWYEQVEALEKAVVNNQGIDFIKLNEDKTTDSVTGCTISIDGLYRALEKALEKAKK